MKKVTLDVLKGSDVKALLEQIINDGRINTLPEIMQFLSEVPEGMSLKDYISSIAGSAETVPDNSVGSEQLKDDSVQMNDLTPDVRERMLNELEEEDIEEWFSEDYQDDDEPEGDSSSSDIPDDGESSSSSSDGGDDTSSSSSDLTPPTEEGTEPEQ